MYKSLKHYMHVYRAELTKVLFFVLIVGFLIIVTVGVIAEKEVNWDIVAVAGGISGFCLLLLFAFIIKNQTLDMFRLSDLGITVYSIFSKKNILWNQIADIRCRKIDFRGIARRKIMITYMNHSNHYDNILIDYEYDTSSELINILYQNINFNNDLTNLFTETETETLSSVIKLIINEKSYYKVNDEEIYNYYKPKRIYKDKQKHTNTVLGYFIWPLFSAMISAFFLLINIKMAIIVLVVGVIICSLYIVNSTIRGVGFNEVEINRNSIIINNKQEKVIIEKSSITKIVCKSKEINRVKLKYYHINYIDNYNNEVIEAISHNFWLEEYLSKYYAELLKA